jgi:hypothetical protein
MSTATTNLPRIITAGKLHRRKITESVGRHEIARERSGTTVAACIIVLIASTMANPGGMTGPINVTTSDDRKS